MACQMVEKLSKVSSLALRVWMAARMRQIAKGDAAGARFCRYLEATRSFQQAVLSEAKQQQCSLGTGVTLPPPALIPLTRGCFRHPAFDAPSLLSGTSHVSSNTKLLTYRLVLKWRLRYFSGVQQLTSRKHHEFRL